MWKRLGEDRTGRSEIESYAQTRPRTPVRRTSRWSSARILGTACLVTVLAVSTSSARKTIADTTASADGGAVIAQSGSYSLTRADVDAETMLYDVAAAKPLPHDDRLALQRILVAEFESDPAKISARYSAIRRAAAVLQNSDDAFQRAVVREGMWENLSRQASESSFSAAGFHLLERRAPPIASSGAFVVTKGDVDALFELRDAVGKYAGLTASTSNDRASFSAKLSDTFAGMTTAQKAEIGQAEIRALAVRAMLANAGIQYSTQKEIHGCVRSPEDVATEARSLGDVGLKFMAATGQLGAGPRTGTDIASINSRANATGTLTELEDGALFWPNRPCGHN